MGGARGRSPRGWCVVARGADADITCGGAMQENCSGACACALCIEALTVLTALALRVLCAMPLARALHCFVA